MSNELLVILMFGGLLCGWALLSVMGAERQRLLAESEARRARSQSPVTPSGTPTTNHPPARSTAKSTTVKTPPPDRPAAAKPARGAKNAR